jgi:uncharacterized membrane protein
MSVKFYKLLTVFSTGALCYGLMEILNRGFTHITMGLLGGLAFTVIHILNGERQKGKITLTPLLSISAGFITSTELLTGEIVNNILDLNVWSYSQMPFNFDGQICLPFSAIWFVLSFVGIVADNFIRQRMFGENTAQQNSGITGGAE